MLRYKFRLKPTAELEVKLVQFGAYVLSLWDLLLSENMSRVQYDKTFLSYKKMTGLIKDLKNFEAFSCLKGFDSEPAQKVTRDLETALKNSFTKSRLQKPPIFNVSLKQKKLHNDDLRRINNPNCIRIKNGAISLPKIGKVGVVQHRKSACKIKTATVQMSHKKWNIPLIQEVECNTAKRLLPTIASHDFDSQHTVVGSNGWYVKKPKVLIKASTKLKQIQVQLSRRGNLWMHVHI